MLVEFKFGQFSEFNTGRVLSFSNTGITVKYKDCDVHCPISLINKVIRPISNLTIEDVIFYDGKFYNISKISRNMLEVESAVTGVASTLSNVKESVTILKRI